ncbi:hypothetical protein UB34_20115, partial [Photobacterium leiognathi]
EGRAAWINQTWKLATDNHPERVYLRDAYLTAQDSSLPPTEIDLTAITGNASYDAVIYVKQDLSRSNIEWLGEWASNKTVLKFEQASPFSDQMGASAQGLGNQNFTFGVNVPYGRFVHLHYVYLDNPDNDVTTNDQKYQLYIDNELAGEISQPFAGPINYAATHLGLREFNQTNAFESLDGLYAFSAFNIALSEPERQALFDATQIEDPDGDGVWNAFDLNKYAPVANDKTLTTNEDISLPFSSNDFVMSDKDGDSLTSITITSLPDVSKGVLQLNGNDVNVDDEIAENDIKDLAYVPEPNVVDSGQFTYTAEDRANGNHSQSATITININPQNDPPTGQNFAFNVDEDTSPAILAFADWNTIFDDIDGDNLASITVTQLPNFGELQLNNVTINAVPQQISETALRNGDFSYHFNGDINGSPYTTFNFTVSDGLANSVGYTATLNITPVDDNPQLTVNAPSQAFVENDNALVIDSNLTIIDADGSDMQSATVTIQDASSDEQLTIPPSSLPNNLTQSYDPATGTLSLTGPGTINDYQSALRALTYQHTGSALGVINRDITFTITDDTNLSNNATSVTVVVLGFYDNIAAFADSTNANHSLAHRPTHGHYTGAGLVAFRDGYFIDPNSDSTTRVNQFLQSEWSNLSINDAATLSAALKAQPDDDKDGQPAYYDEDDALFHLNSYFVLLPEIDQTLPTVNNDYLFSAKVQIAGQSVQEIFITHNRNAADAEQRHIWPKVIADAIESEMSSLSVNAYDKDSGTSSPTVSSANRNVIEGVQWIELSYIEQWQAINAYRTDITNTVMAPDETDYNVISVTQIDRNQFAELNILLRNTNPSNYAATVELITSYDIIYEYALATGSPITATKPEMADYGNIGITQDLNNTRGFNDWLNAAQLVQADNINAMIEIINFSNGIRVGGLTPALAQYALAGITGTSTISQTELNDIEQELEGSSQQTLAEVQAIFNKYNSWQALIDYANGGGSTPQPATYLNVGFANLTGNEINQLNNWLREQTLDTEQKITSAVNIVTYFSGNRTNAPFASDYQNIGISKDVSEVISAVNSLTIDKDDTIGTLQTSIDNIDFDNDSVAFVDDLDDTNPWTDFDQDGLNDKMETVLNGFDPLNDDRNSMLNDANGNRIADIWQQMTDTSDADIRNKAIGYFINGQLAEKASSGPRTLSNISSNPIYSENWDTISSNATYELVAYLDFSNEESNPLLTEGILIQSGNMSLRFASEGKKQFAIRSDGQGDREETTQTSSAHFFTATDNQSTLFPSRQYFHLVLTFDGTSQTFTLFINGSEVGHVQDSSFTAFNSSNSKIGVFAQGILSGTLKNYLVLNWVRKNMVTHIQYHDSIWSQQTIQSRADIILAAIKDANKNGIWDAFDLDKDSDGLVVTEDSDDNNSYSQTDSDVLNDQFETTLGFDAVSNDDSNLLTDDNGSRVAVLWDQVKVSPNAMASWINQTWSVESSNLNPTVTLTQPIAGYDNYVYPNEAKTVDLSALPSDQASYEFIVQITSDNFADVTLLGHHDTSDTDNATSLTFENSDLSKLGVVLNNSGSVNLTNVFDDASPYGDIAHLVYVYEQSSDTYTIYINGQVAATAQSAQLSAIRSPSTPIGLFAKDSTGTSNIAQLDSMDGIYAFAAYPTALAESDIQTLANTLTSVTLDSDNDGVWDSFDLNKFTPDAANNSLNTAEDTELRFTQAQFGFTDLDPNDQLSSITVISLPDPTRGQLLLTTNPITAANTVVNATAITNGDLSYQPATNNNSQVEFDFNVSDGQNISETAQMTITITPDNDAPVINNQMPTTSVDEDNSYTYQPQIADVDHTEAQLTVTVTGAPWLNWDNTNKQVTGTPDNSHVGSYAMRLEVSDGDKSDVIQWTLTVNNTNDAPTGQDESITIDEDTSPLTFAASDFTFRDVDVGDALENIIITTVPSKGTLEIGGIPVTAVPATVTLSQLNNSEFTYLFNGNEFGSAYTNFDFKLNDGEQDSAADYNFTITINNVEDDLTIAITQPNPISEDDATVTAPFTFASFSIDDKNENDTGNTQLSNNNNGHYVLSGNNIQLTQAGINTLNNGQALDTASLTVIDTGSGNPITENHTVTVSYVNDAPEAPSPRSVQSLEDQTHVFTVSEFSFADEESADLSEIKLTQLPANGDLWLNGNKITQNDTPVSYNDINNGNLSYQPVDHAFGSESFTYQVSDGQLWSTNGTMTLTINPVNDAPVAQTSSITVDEDQEYAITYADFQFTDEESNALTKVTISQLPDQGIIKLDGNDISANDEISVTEINADKLTYQTALNDISTTSLEFSVYDGTDYSANRAVMTINVNNINDVPNATDHTINVTEDSEYAFSTTVIDLMFADDDNSDQLETLIIESLPSNGTLKINDGSNETLINNLQLPKSISRADIGQLRYINDSNDTTQTLFTYKVHDGTSVSNNTGTLTINISPDDDNPLSVDGFIDVIEDTSFSSFSYLIVPSNNIPAAASGEIRYRDPDYDDDVTATALFGFTEISLESLPAHGELTISGTPQPLILNDTVLASDIANLIYTPGANREDNTQFTFKVKSTDKFSQNSATMVINIQADNDAPNAVASSIQVDEDTLFPFIQSHFGYSDIENNAMASVALYQPDNGDIYFDASGNFNGAETTVFGYPVTILTNDINQYAYKTAQDQDTQTQLLFSVNDGNSNSAQATLTINVTPINDAPVIDVGLSISVLEDDLYSFKSNDITYSDPENNGLAKIKITALPKGELRFKNTLVTTGQEIDFTDIGDLTYQSDLHDDVNTSFEFQVMDDDSSSYSAAETMSVNIQPENDAPTITLNPIAGGITENKVNRQTQLLDYLTIDPENDNLTVQIINDTNNWFVLDTITQSVTPTLAAIAAINDDSQSLTQLTIELEVSDGNLSNTQKANIAITRTTDMDDWYSVITINPVPPVTTVSNVDLSAANTFEDKSPSSGEYQVNYFYLSDLAPNTRYTDIANTPPGTTTLTVQAEQISLSDISIFRTLENDFVFSSDPANLIRVLTPRLVYDDPLQPTDSIDLLNKEYLIAAIENIKNNNPTVEVTYQWQEHDGSDWASIGSELASYQPLSGIQLANKYRLQLLAENSSTTLLVDDTFSDESIYVTSEPIDYDIRFAPLSIPQQGIVQTVHSRLIASPAPALFSERKISWQRVNLDNTLTPLTANPDGSYLPTLLDVGLALRITVEYLDGTTSLVSRSILTSPVDSDSTSQALNDLANSLNLTIAPTLLSTGQEVALSNDDIIKIRVQESTIQTEYQWQYSANGQTWLPITNSANEAVFITTYNEDNQHLRLQITMSMISDNTIKLAPLYTNTTDQVQPHTGSKLEDLTLDFDANTYSLTERATIWLNKYQKDNNVTITSYQWYRVPEGGNIT